MCVCVCSGEELCVPAMCTGVVLAVLIVIGYSCWRYLVPLAQRKWRASGRKMRVDDNGIGDAGVGDAGVGDTGVGDAGVADTEVDESDFIIPEVNSSLSADCYKGEWH